MQGEVTVHDADINGDGRVNLVDYGWMASFWLERVPSGPEGLVFATIEGGTFQMGDSLNDVLGFDWEKPVHTVTLNYEPVVIGSAGGSGSKRDPG